MEIKEFFMKPKEIKLVEALKKDWKGYCLERKYDGSRHLFIDGNLWSKRSVKRNERYKHLLNELNKLPNCILDCEVYVEGGTVLDLNAKINWNKTQCCVFDVLKIGQNDLRNESFAVRNQRLKDLLKEYKINTKLIHVPECWINKDEAWKEVINRKLEGLVAKKMMSKYYCGKRSLDWVKIKRKFCVDVKIIGHEAGSTKGTFLCETEKGIPIRVSGTSVDIVNFWKQNKPEKMEINYMYKTNTGKLFQPVFVKFVGY